MGATAFAAIAVGDAVVVSNADTSCTGAACCAAAGTYTVTSNTGTYVIGVKEIVVADTASHCKIARPAYPGNNAAVGGSESSTATTTLIKHYVETEDTMDNMQRTHGIGNGFVQRSKHGGIYTWGNLERYPFGKPTTTGSKRGSGNLHETGFTTYGYTSYESLYGYVQPGGTNGGTQGNLCAPTAMGMSYHASESAAVAMSADATIQNKKMTFTFNNDAPDVVKGDILTVEQVSATCALVGTYTVYSRSATSIVVVEPSTAAVEAAGTGETGTKCNARRKDGLYRTSSGAAVTSNAADSTYVSTCTDADTSYPAPYVDEAAATQVRSGGGDVCVPHTHNDVPCVTRFAEDTDTAAAGIQTAAATGAGTALYQPPKDVLVRVSDNDVITEQATASVDGCRSTQLFQFAQTSTDSVGQRTNVKYDGYGVFQKQWLTDYNCLSGDAGGLPGYPVHVAGTFDGYCTDTTKSTKASCESSKYCTVKGICTYSNAVFAAREQGECGRCDGISSGEGSGQARFTQKECVKDVNGDGTADGTWVTTGYTWSASTSSNWGTPPFRRRGQRQATCNAAAVRQRPARCSRTHSLQTSTASPHARRPTAKLAKEQSGRAEALGRTAPRPQVSSARAPQLQASPARRSRCIVASNAHTLYLTAYTMFTQK